VAGAFTHILTDLYAFIATAVAGLIIVLTGFARADAVATLIVVLLMLHAGYGLIKDSGRIFLEAAPAGLAPAAVGAAMAARPHVAEVHDLHIWEITSGQPAASAHVLVAPGSDCHAARADLEQFLAGCYGISHATLQVDHAPAPAAAPDTVTGCGENPGVPSQHHCDDAHGPSYRPSGASSALRLPEDLGRGLPRICPVSACLDRSPGLRGQDIVPYLEESQQGSPLSEGFAFGFSLVIASLERRNRLQPLQHIRTHRFLQPLVTGWPLLRDNSQEKITQASMLVT
jgi:hypothetical protein